MHRCKDSKGKLWVACSECHIGGNGLSSEKCACGWKCKKKNGLGCFCGEFIKTLKLTEEVS